MILKSFFLCLVCSGIVASSRAQSTPEQLISQVLEEQSLAWNHGDIYGFMKGYWEHDSLMFIGKNGIAYGWKNTLENYKKSYPDSASMGILQFTILHIQRLSDQYYQVVGGWQLTRSMGDLKGHFTLLFRKSGNQWYIISDHSS